MYIYARCSFYNRFALVAIFILAFGVVMMASAAWNWNLYISENLITAGILGILTGIIVLIGTLPGTIRYCRRTLIKAQSGACLQEPYPYCYKIGFRVAVYDLKRQEYPVN